ncbi:hypothetical protein ACO0K1_07880 [Undibacterium sp. SXout20W]
MSLSERSEFRHFPVLRDAQIVLTRSDGTRRAKSASPFFCLLYFGEAKKSKWPPGHTRLGSTKCDRFTDQ